MAVTIQEIDYSSLYTTAQLKARNIYPYIKIFRDSVELGDVIGASITRSRDNISNRFSIEFLGQDEFVYLEPFKPNHLYRIETGYYTGADGKSSLVKNILIEGYSVRLSQGINADEITTKSELEDPATLAKAPFTKKYKLDVYIENADKLDLSDTSMNSGMLTSASQIVNDIMNSLSLNASYKAEDYRIVSYRKEDFPLNIVKELIDFIGAYIRYSYGGGRIEILDRFVESGYHYHYTDYGDIIDLGITDDTKGFINAIRLIGIKPDDKPDYESPTQPGQGIADDNQYYLVDTVQGVEKAPSNPYTEEAPTELIEKKFYNVYLGFDIKKSSIKVEGGTYNYDSGEYEGAEFIDYGGTLSASEVLTTIDSPRQNKGTESSKRTPLPPGEGLVGTPWLYEEHNDASTVRDLTEEDGVYQYGDILGRVVDAQLNDEPIDNAIVEITFLYESNIWQVWKWNAGDLYVKFYTPDGSIDAILGSAWTNVSDEYPTEEWPAPDIVPNQTITASSGASSGLEVGTFLFKRLPISFYNVEASKSGFEPNDLDIEIESDVFDFLTGEDEKDKTKKYKLLDTPYFIPVYAQKAPPIVFGDTDDDAFIEDTRKAIAVEVRHSLGIEKVDGNIVLGGKITDARIINKEIAKIAGLAKIREAESKSQQRRLVLPHNPFLKEGMRIAVTSVAKGWVKKTFTVDSITTAYKISEGEESIWDTVNCVEYLE